MRWKLLVLVPLIAAIVACGAWSLLIVIVMGPVRPSEPHDWLYLAGSTTHWLVLASAGVPLAMAGFAGFFIYRHTSRTRKTQVVLTVLVALHMSIAACLPATSLFPAIARIHPPPTRLCHHYSSPTRHLYL